MVLPRAARTAGEVVLEIRIAAADFDDPLQRLLRKWRSTQIRVDEDSSRVQRTPEPGNFQSPELVKHTMNKIPDIASGLYVLARVDKRVSDGAHDERASVLRRQRSDGIVGEQAVDGRKVPKRVFPGHAPDDREPVRGVRSRSW